MNQTALEYAMGSDWNDRWRTGGTGEEITAEAHLDPASLLAGIKRFTEEREQRLQKARGPEALFAQPAG